MINDYIEIAQQVTGAPPESKPPADHSAQANLGMEFAARQADRASAQPVEVKIPTLGAAPLAN